MIFMMPIRRMIFVVIMIVRPMIASESELDHGRRDQYWGGRADRGRRDVGFLRRLNVYRRGRSNHDRWGRRKWNAKAETDACLGGSRRSE